MKKLNAKGYEQALVERSVQAILSENPLCSLSTVKPDGLPYVNTCFFSYVYPGTLYVLTPPTAQHSRNIDSNPAVAVNVFQSDQASGAELRGLQIFGSCHEATTADELQSAFASYVERFPNINTYAADVGEMLKVFESRLYAISVESFKIFDEPTFGKEVWVTAQVED